MISTKNTKTCNISFFSRGLDTDKNDVIQLKSAIDNKTGELLKISHNTIANVETTINPKIIDVKFADAELYHSEIVEGLTKMKQVKHIEIPPQKAKSLKPGSHHIMFSNLSIELIKGISLEGVMIFEKAGRIPVEFEVESQQTTNDHMDY